MTPTKILTLPPEIAAALDTWRQEGHRYGESYVEDLLLDLLREVDDAPLAVTGPSDDTAALDRVAALLNASPEWEASHLDDVAAIVVSTGRNLRSSEETFAIAYVVDDLAEHFAIPEDVARPVVERFSDSGDANGYSTLAGAVEENTSYVVAEWLVHEAYFEGEGR